MALDDNNSVGGLSATMPVQPMYGGYPMAGNFGGGYGGFGGMFGQDGLWILLLLLICGGGWGGLGGFGGFGMGGMWPMMMGAAGAGLGIDYLYPWLNNSEHISDGFRDQMTNSAINGIQSSITSGFGDVQTALCNGFGTVNQAVSNAAAGINQNISTTGAGIQNSLCSGFAGVNLGMANGFNGVNQTIASTAANAETAANSRHSALTGQLYNNEIANLNRSFAEQTANTQGFNALQGQLAQCCCDNRAGIESLRYTVATENCADRAAVSDGIRDVIANQTGNTTALLNSIQGGIQSIKDQLCNDKIDAKNDTIAQLRQELLYARGQASQDVQTARILAGQVSETDAIYNRLSQCPVGTVPVYGNQPVFTCQQGCGCGQ